LHALYHLRHFIEALGDYLVPPNYLVFIPFLTLTTMPTAKKSRIRHLSKAVTWRIIASGTTFLLAWFFFQEDAKAVQKATSVAVAESVLKMALYYFHERAWYRYGKLGRK
jgi:uncharacterized membrane protein